MRAQIGTRLELLIIEVGVEVLCLQIIHDPHRWHSAWELAERLIDILGLNREQIDEFLVERRSSCPHSCRVLPRTRRIRIERTTLTEFAFDQSLDNCTHRPEMLTGKGLKHTVTPRRIWHQPTDIDVEPKPQPRNLRVARRAKDRKSVDAVEAPPAESDRAQGQMPDIGRRHQLSTCLSQGILLDEAQRLRIFRMLETMSELLHPWNRPIVDVVVDGVPILGEERDVEQRLLSKIRHRNDK